MARSPALPCMVRHPVFWKKRCLRGLGTPAIIPCMGRRYDHIDLRVRSLDDVREFYTALLPALGFTHKVDVKGWLQFEAVDRGVATEFFGVTESSDHVPNECRIAFWAESKRELDRLVEIVIRAGAQNVEGPGYDEGPGYYAVFFEDPNGNRLEICHREEGAT
jgi:catechol 2,3-dioxygenase-like lactoylglutathione lyase family enzyme